MYALCRCWYCVDLSCCVFILFFLFAFFSTAPFWQNEDTSCCATSEQLVVINTVTRLLLITHDGQTVYSQQEGVYVSTFVLTSYTPRRSLTLITSDHFRITSTPPTINDRCLISHQTPSFGIRMLTRRHGWARAGLTIRGPIRKAGSFSRTRSQEFFLFSPKKLTTFLVVVMFKRIH